MKKSIPKIMLEDHRKINTMLSDFIEEAEKNPKNNTEIMNKFLKFKWNLEKHFFVEEKVIFGIYTNSKEDESEDIFKLLREHKNMLWLINRIEIDLIDNLPPKLENLNDSKKSC